MLQNYLTVLPTSLSSPLFRSYFPSVPLRFPFVDLVTVDGGRDRHLTLRFERMKSSYIFQDLRRVIQRRKRGRRFLVSLIYKVEKQKTVSPPKKFVFFLEISYPSIPNPLKIVSWSLLSFTISKPVWVCVLRKRSILSDIFLTTSLNT